MKRLTNKDYSDVLSKGEKFIKDIEKDDNLVLIHHIDTDGYCSAALAVSALRKMGVDNVETFATGVEDFEELAKNDLFKKFNKFIILDLDVPHLTKYTESENISGLIIDHHMLRKNLNTNNIIYINPRFSEEEIYQPASYVTYKFFSNIIDITDKEWVAVLGTVGDYAFDDCKDLITKWTNAEKKDDIPETKFWEASNLLYSSILTAVSGKTEIGLRDILEILISCESLQDLKKNGQIKESYEIFTENYKKSKNEFWENSETIDNIVISIIYPEIERMGSPVVTSISTDKREKIIFLLEKRGSRLKIHARCQSGCVHLGKIMQKCVGGGGHRHAAGGSISPEEFDEFKECVVREIDNILNN